jgi:hypothetical protein
MEDSNEAEVSVVKAKLKGQSGMPECLTFIEKSPPEGFNAEVAEEAFRVLSSRLS